MNVYHRRKHLKLILFIVALLISIASFFFLNSLITRLKQEERAKVMLWAQAVQRKAAMVEYTRSLFDKLKQDERHKVEIWSEAMHRLLIASESDDLTFLVKIISTNQNIPIILTNKQDIVLSSINVDFPVPQGQPLDPQVKRAFSRHKPIAVRYGNETLNYLYYQDSKLFTELQTTMNDMIRSFISEVVQNTASVPVVITDTTGRMIIATGNLDSVTSNNLNLLYKRILSMANTNQPIPISLSSKMNGLVFYENSYLLTRLKYFPFIVFLLVVIFILVAYIAFASSRRYEQNQVWVGMSKETAHQLGTPISSLMAWIEILKMQEIDADIITELNKDIVRLQVITDRFSKIGAPPVLEPQNIVSVVVQTVDYIAARSSSKVSFSVNPNVGTELVPISIALFEWVIENLCKNAVDAVNGKGQIHIEIQNRDQQVIIDVSDTGKGIHRKQFKTVFQPGFTTKKRGWGLGLTLAKRIVEEYHHGKIFVKQSEIDKGTTFRIILNKTLK